MKLLFKQRFFSVLDSYDIYSEDGSVAYTVKGKLSFSHRLTVYSAQGYEVGTIREAIFALLPRFEIYLGSNLVGFIRKEFSLFKPRYDIDYNGWHIDGDFWGWDYRIIDSGGGLVGTVSKELLHLTDTYVIDVVKSADALLALMFVIAIDAEKCTASKHS